MFLLGEAGEGAGQLRHVSGELVGALTLKLSLVTLAVGAGAFVQPFGPLVLDSGLQLGDTGRQLGDAGRIVRPIARTIARPECGRLAGRIVVRNAALSALE